MTSLTERKMRKRNKDENGDRLKKKQIICKEIKKRDNESRMELKRKSIWLGTKKLKTKQKI
jgi:hypothetical protein